MKIIIDGIEYMPKVELKELDDNKTTEVLKALTSMLYFQEKHKSMSHAFEILEIISPDLARLCVHSERDAFNFMHKDD